MQPQKSKGWAQAPQGQSGGAVDNKLPFILPPLMFTLISALFTFGYYHVPGLTWMTVIICSFFSMLFYFQAAEAAGGIPTPMQRRARALALLSTFAIVTGALGGWFNFQWHMYSYWKYQDSREYHNVLPTEPAAAHADAGEITFSENSHIDSTKAVGFRAGSTYCVAPVMVAGQSSRVEFWAVGMDCCDERGAFTCDDAGVEGNHAARGGIVVHDDDLMSHSSFDYYRQAVRLSEAANDLAESSDPLFLRWVENPGSVQARKFSSGTGTWVGFSALHVLLNAGLFMGVNFMTPKKKAGLPGP